MTTPHRFECSSCGRSFAAPTAQVLAYNAAKHRTVCGRVPLPNGRPTALPPEVVARIDRERHAGRSLRAIAVGLERDGVPTAHGGTRWHASTVRAVVSRARRARP